MYLILNKKKLEIVELKTSKEKFKSLKFILEPIDKVYRFTNKKILSTYFFCQNIDVVTTDSKDFIIDVYPKVRSEKILFLNRKNKYTYLLPLNSIDNLKSEKLEIKKGTN